MRQLARTLDLWSVVAISMGAMLGSGVFVLPGMAMAIAGPSVWLVYIVAGVCVLPAAISTAELATAMPTSGGKYFFIDRTFGPLAGTASGVGLWFSLVLKSAFALVGFGVYLCVIVDLPLKPTALTMLGAIVLLNLLGASAVAKALKWIVAACVLCLILLVAAGVGFVEVSRLGPPLPNGAFGFATAVGFVFVSFAGVTKVAAVAEEIKDPHRNLPLGILLSLGVVTLIYGAVVLILVGLVPASDLAGDLHPIFLMAQRAGGTTAGLVIAVLAILTMVSEANAGLLAASRFPFAMSRDNLVPRLLSSVHPRFRTPSRSIALTGSVIGLAILLVEVESIAKLASSFLIIMFVAVNCAVIVLRESDAQWYRPPFHAPFYPVIQVLGILTGLFLLYLIGALALGAAVVIVLPGAIFYAAYGRRRTSRRGVMRKIGDAHKRVDPIPDIEATSHGAASMKSGVVVALFGLERSPEMVVEVGTALSQDRSLRVVHVTEVPEQMFLDVQAHEELVVASLERRINTMGRKIRFEIRFDNVVTHDLVSTVRQASEGSGCNWVLKEWRRGGGHGALLRNPLAWSLYALPCNLALFKDAGVRYVQRILVYAQPGPNDALVVSTSDHLAQLWGAELTFVRFVPEGAPDTAVQAQIDYLDELIHLCHQRSTHQILRGPDELQALVDLTAGYDLLVMGEAEQGFFRTVFFNPREKLTQRAACSVLRLKTPRKKIHAALQVERTHSDARHATLLDFVSPATVGVHLSVASKEALFRRMGEVLAQSLPDVAAATVTKSLWKREEMQNTAVGDGLALPHGTLLEIDQPLVGIFTVAKPLDYGVPGGSAVEVCLVTLCPPSKRQVHLMLLANIARLVEQTNFFGQLKSAQTADEVIQVLRDSQGQIEK